MMTRNKLSEIIVDCLKRNNGKATLLEVSKYIWNNYENELRESGRMFYTWQYDLRWEATKLRKRKVIRNSEDNAFWELIIANDV